MVERSRDLMMVFFPICMTIPFPAPFRAGATGKGKTNSLAPP